MAVKRFENRFEAAAVEVLLFVLGEIGRRMKADDGDATAEGGTEGNEVVDAGESGLVGSFVTTDLDRERHGGDSDRGRLGRGRRLAGEHDTVVPGFGGDFRHAGPAGFPADGAAMQRELSSHVTMVACLGMTTT